MNVLKAPNHVVPTQSAKTCRGDTSAAACLVSLLPLEMTGPQESRVISHAQVMLSGMGLGWTATTSGQCLSPEPQSLVCSLSSTAPQTSMNASPMGSAQSMLSVSTPWEATIAAARLDSSLTTRAVKV